jgi:hypothetical protein
LTTEVTLDPPNPIADRAVALAAASHVGGAGGGEELGELIRLADDDAVRLVEARDVLVRRIQLRSDDYAATGGLTLLNAAIAGVGWHGDFTWKPRNWKLPS